MTLYVNADAGSAGSGTADHPFSTISEAARLARPGDEVLVFPGIPRDSRNRGSPDYLSFS